MSAALAFAALTYWGAHDVFGVLNDLARGDIKLHNRMLVATPGRTAQPTGGYTIYYTLLSWFAGGELTPDGVRAASESLLALGMAAKAVVTLCVVHRATGSLGRGLAAATFLMLASPANLQSTPEMYFGRFAGTIWHNSTTVILMPVSLLLFFAALRFLRATPPRWALWAVPGLVALDALLKPNYLLALLPALAVLTAILMARALRVTGDPAATGPPLGRLLLMAIPAVALLGGEYVLAYLHGGVSFSLGLQPLATWTLFASVLPHGIPLAIVESFLLPAVITGVTWRSARRSVHLLVAWLVTAVAVLQFAVFAEYDANGSLLTHGNWTWGGHVATYVLFTTAVIHWIRHRSDVPRWATALVWVVALGHLASGIVYLDHLVTPGGPGYH